MNSEIEGTVQAEITRLHEFFVDWFSGAVSPEALEDALVSRLHVQLLYVTPDGNRLSRDQLVAMLRKAHGSNSDFRIEVRDVVVRHESSEHLLITYTEVQHGARNSKQSDNARMTTALLSRTTPLVWLHIHETAIPLDE